MGFFDKVKDALTGSDEARAENARERAREALFGILEHGLPPVRGARFLDLFCGSGAVGLEAASRGAAEVLLVERDRAALTLARANLVRLGAPPDVRLLAADAARLAAARHHRDPSTGPGDVPRLLERPGRDRA